MRDILRLSLPLTLWLATFSGLYALHGLLCSSRFAQAATPDEAGRFLLTAAALLAVALQVALLLALRSGRWGAPSGFVRRTSLTLGLIALVATIWTSLPIAAVSHCL